MSVLLHQRQQQHVKQVNTQWWLAVVLHGQ